MILLKVIAVKSALFVTIGFFNHGFKFQDFVCNSCHDLTMLCLNISNIAIIITIQGLDYRCIIHNIIHSKSEEINLLENSVLKDCSESAIIILII